jgi:hypothetical protein
MHGIPVVGAGQREDKDDINTRIGYDNLAAGMGSAHSSVSKIAWRWRAVAMAVMKSSS